ncbi:MAG: hypothetical protein ABIJ45_09355 [Candidatus Zixiibacteriota bacterium]
MKYRTLIYLLPALLLLWYGAAYSDGGTLLELQDVEHNIHDANDPRVVQHGFHSLPSPRNILNLKRDNPWSMPKLSSSEANQPDTLHILAMRFDFIADNNDSTTGNGKFDTLDYNHFEQLYHHTIDPSPHNKTYFESQLKALKNYYYFVSRGKLVLTYDVYPQTDETTVYHLPNKMEYYGGKNSSIGNGLTNYLLDCFDVADNDPTIDFSEYDSYILFHAGSDRQNDIYPIDNEYPPGGIVGKTPFDLFTGYIYLIDTAMTLDQDAGDPVEIMDALIMPELCSQDNRATALNAVMAHEFGHQLGLPDIYRTDNFVTRVGDFALMDNNGFGTGIDFGFAEVGRVFGAMPVYPTAWSRAFLGFDEPVVYDQGESIDILAAAADIAANGVRIAKIPINEYEYYLIENRQVETDGEETYALADSVTSVIQGPVNIQKELTGEYDFLLPGSGMLIWKVDELVSYLDYDNNGRNNYVDNQLQGDAYRPFMRIIEADGRVNFGPDYYAGFGTAEDMFSASNNNSFTPNSNPPSISYGGVNTHIYVDNISQSKQIMSFDLETGFKSNGFPIRAGMPLFGLSPIACDINGDDSTEIIIVSGRNLLVVKEDGSDYNPPFLSEQAVYDTAFVLGHDEEYFHDNLNIRDYPLPVFAQPPDIITAGPVVGDFGESLDSLYIVVGVAPYLYVYSQRDYDVDGKAELQFPRIMFGNYTDVELILYLSFGKNIIVGTSRSDGSLVAFYKVEYFTGNDSLHIVKIIDAEELELNDLTLMGAVRMDENLAFIAGDSTNVLLNYYSADLDTVYSYDLNGYYNYGPVGTNIDRDSLMLPEIIVASNIGQVKIVTIDTSVTPPVFTFKYDYLGDSLFVNPSIADIDMDGYPDIILGGNKIYALDRNLINVTNFPLTIDYAFPDGYLFETPVIGDISGDGAKDVVVIASTDQYNYYYPNYLAHSDPDYSTAFYDSLYAIAGYGNCYAFNSTYGINEELIYGFPVTAGGIGFGSPTLFKKQNGGGLGILGADGWFYSYDISYDSSSFDWAMGGHDPQGTNYFPVSQLGPTKPSSNSLPEDQYICYPNPTYTGETTFRYYLGSEADVELTLFDFSGREIDNHQMMGIGNSNNEYTWDLSFLPPGVYRCVLVANFIGGGEKTAFCDVAIIK